MARKPADHLTWFKHPVNLSDSPAIRAVEAVLGDSGYALALKCMEHIYATPGLEWSVPTGANLTALLSQLRKTEPELDNFVSTAIEAGLFDADPWTSRRTLTASSIKTEAAITLAAREKMAERKRRQRQIELPPPPAAPAPVLEEVKKQKPKPEKKSAALTEEERKRLGPKLNRWLTRFGLPETAGTVEELLEDFYAKKESRGYVYASDRAALDSWAIKAYCEKLVEIEKGKLTLKKVNGVSPSFTERDREARERRKREQEERLRRMEAR